MLKVVRAGVPEPVLVDPTTEGWTLPADVVWLDLFAPTAEEDVALEGALGVPLPTREDMAEIEASSRAYLDEGATYMTATVLYNVDAEVPASGPITFVLTGGRLVTIRYFEPRSFKTFVANLERQTEPCRSGVETFVGLFEAIVDRTADNLERTSAEVEDISRTVFARRKPTSFEQILTRLGRNQNANAKVHDSLATLARMASFAALSADIEKNAEARHRLKTAARDVQSLIEHSAYLAGNITFLLDAALGMINIEQNAIIKIFSVAAVAFLPPTLIASIYGMNFEHMPELHSAAAYPTVLVLMVVSAVAPLWWFHRKGWL
ncbi:magnesium transporter CorA family protein [Caulobacter sp. 17J65-9]|uniref:magnesium transporter CorA family protein n=1 Tax=Caulobacter sp. 17J65-9 TaxID=2709382 RepID=UPI0013C6DDFC|nr:magnesium transporter CorA family protein [Caulobacter sp. 17J65-9]NEX94806.1 magnesium transporter CorA family protein [Caulobacter sp. 17J65-9]